MSGKGDTPRPVDPKIYGKYYESIDWDHHEPTRIVDGNKNPLKLSSRQKNGIYKKAKELKAELRDALCTKTECFKPTDANISKMINREMKVKDKIDKFKKSMKAIGADPRDYNIELFRKGR